MIRKCTTMSLVAVLATGAVLLACATNVAALGRAPAPNNLPECSVEPGRGTPGRALILIQGILSRSVSEPMWDDLTDELADLYGGFIYFSYSGRPHDYSAADTLQSITAHDVPLLVQLISSCHLQGWTSFDLIGHSKGGVVANEYIKAYGRTGAQAGLVRHVITLDAPVNGSELAWLLLHGPATEYPAPWWGWDQAGGEGVAELAQMYEDRETMRQLNHEAAWQLRQRGSCILTLTNDQDAAISQADAIIDGFGKSYDLGTDIRGDLGRRLGHHRTLDVPNESSELQDIRECLSGRFPVDGFAAQPLPGLRESLVHFLSDTAQQLGLMLSELGP